MFLVTLDTASLAVFRSVAGLETAEAEIEFKWLHHKGTQMRGFENVVSYQADSRMGSYKKPYVFKLGKLANQTGFEQVPDTYELLQNHPNPVTDHTYFFYHLPEAGDIRLVLYDLHGHQVMILDEGHREAGSYELKWDGRAAHGEDLPAGMYIYILEVNGQRLIKHLVK